MWIAIHASDEVVAGGYRIYDCWGFAINFFMIPRSPKFNFSFN